MLRSGLCNLLSPSVGAQTAPGILTLEAFGVVLRQLFSDCFIHFICLLIHPSEAELVKHNDRLTVMLSKSHLYID